jgi:hypothetical protein
MGRQDSDARVDRMLTHMRAFQKMPGRWDEGPKGREYGRFQAAWNEATVPERQRYQAAIFREIRERHARPERSPAPVADLAARRRQRVAGRPRLWAGGSLASAPPPVSRSARTGRPSGSGTATSGMRARPASAGKQTGAAA